MKHLHFLAWLINLYNMVQKVTKWLPCMLSIFTYFSFSSKKIFLMRTRDLPGLPWPTHFQNSWLSATFRNLQELVDTLESQINPRKNSNATGDGLMKGSSPLKNTQLRHEFTDGLLNSYRKKDAITHPAHASGLNFNIERMIHLMISLLRDWKTMRNKRIRLLYLGKLYGSCHDASLTQSSDD